MSQVKSSFMGVTIFPDNDKNNFRKNRFRLVRRLIDDVLATKSTCRIVDLGGTHAYWRNFGGALPSGVSVKVVDLAAPDEHDTEQVVYEHGDACAMNYGDNDFDIVHSNSTIEHVGLWSKMSEMAAEVRRLAPRYFIQTPNFWFPYEPHARTPLFHFLPEPVRASMILKKQRGWMKGSDIGQATEAVQSAILLSHAQMHHLFPDASIAREKFYGLTKSLVAVKGLGADVRL